MTALPQHMQALQHANQVRIGIRKFRADVAEMTPAEGAMEIARIIEDEHDGDLGGSRIAFLMLAVRKLGQSRVTKCLLAAGVHNGDRRLRDLTARQRGAIVIQLEMWARSWS